jgi:hypothetical protein
MEVSMQINSVVKQVAEAIADRFLKKGTDEERYAFIQGIAVGISLSQGEMMEITRSIKLKV